MNLNKFESCIDKKILARGYDYYENDYVKSVEETEDNVYEAEVEGTELYTVKVELDDKANILDAQDDCPYDMGEYCKHQVAVFLALRDMKNNMAGGNSPMQKNNNMHPEAALKCSVPKKRKAPDIKKILSKRSKDELVAEKRDIR